MDCKKHEDFDYTELARHISVPKDESLFGVNYFGTRWESRSVFDQSLLKYIQAIQSAYRESASGYRTNNDVAEDKPIFSAPPTGLYLITFQRPLQPVIDLLRRKRVCNTGQGAAIWSKDLESKLSAAIRDANLARLFVACI